jgi:hypothetical protein
MIGHRPSPAHHLRAARQAEQGGVGILLRHRVPDELVIRIVAGWPERVTAQRARSLGFQAETDFEDIVRAKENSSGERRAQLVTDVAEEEGLRSVAVLDSACNAHQAHIVTQELARNLLRYLVVVALATHAHAREGGGGSPPARLGSDGVLGRRQVEVGCSRAPGGCRAPRPRMHPRQDRGEWRPQRLHPRTGDDRARASVRAAPRRRTRSTAAASAVAKLATSIVRSRLLVSVVTAGTVTRMFRSGGPGASIPDPSLPRPP